MIWHWQTWVLVAVVLGLPLLWGYASVLWGERRARRLAEPPAREMDIGTDTIF